MSSNVTVIEVFLIVFGQKLSYMTQNNTVNQTLTTRYWSDQFIVGLIHGEFFPSFFVTYFLSFFLSFLPREKQDLSRMLG